MAKTIAILIARLIFAFGFAQAAAFKFVFMGMDATAAEIAGAGFPLPHLLAWVAAFFEAALAIAFLTGLFFTEAAIVSIAYVLFLAFSFHGPDHWAGNPMEYGFFTDHFIFIAGLLFAAVHGPGSALVLRTRFDSRRI
jgi:putative oxidoreductase